MKERTTRVVTGASLAVMLLALLFLVLGLGWAYLRLLLCAGSAVRPLCTQSYVIPTSLAVLSLGAFGCVLLALSFHATAHGDRLPPLHPLKPVRGFHHLPTRRHRRLVRSAHVSAWTVAGLVAAFVAWFHWGASSQIAVAIGVLVPAAAIVTAFTFLAEQVEKS